MQSRQISRWLAAVALVVLTFSGVGYGQTDTAAVSGRITDPSGAIVPGAEIVLQNAATGTSSTVLSNKDGLYVFPAVEPGVYNITVRKAGFQELHYLRLTANVQAHIAQNFKLRLGPTSETVTVTAATPMVDTSDGTVSTVVDRNFVDSIPLNGRSFQALIDLAPGVQANVTSSGEQGQFNVNGQRADANYFTVDGVSANVGSWNFPGQYAQASSGSLPATNIQGGFNNLVSVDDLQEFRILTSSFSPEFGRSPGGQIILATRSGTGQYHGDVYEYFRNEAFDANDWFANSLGLPRAPLRLNDYGGTFGGPLRFPGHGGEARTFFFFSYEHQNLKLPQTLLSTVPSLSARASATSDTAAVLNSFPKPNGPDQPPDGAAFNTGFGAPTKSYDTSFRVDHRFNGKYSLFGRFNYSPSSAQSLDSYDLAEADTLETNTQTYTVGATQAFSARWINEVRGNYTQVVGSATAAITNLGGATPIPNSLLWPANFIPKYGYSIFSIAGVGGSFNIGPTSGRENSNVPHQYEAIDNLAYIHGAHQFKFGVDYRLIKTDISPITLGSNIIFQPDAMNGPTGIEKMNSGTDTFALYFDIPGETIDYNALSFYAQDQWQVTPRLTLTYGSRWEINPSPTTVAGQKPYTACCSNDLSNLTLSAAGASYYPTNYHEFAPRLGVAYQIVPTAGHQLVLRGGVGSFYDLGQAGYFGNNYWPYGAFIFDFGTPFPVPPSYSTFPPPDTVPSPGNPANVTMAVSGFVLPRTYEWNVTLEQGLGSNQALSVAYVAAHGRDLLRNETYSSPNPNFSAVSLVTNAGFSDYDSLQVQFTRRLSHGLQALASYTYGHSLDNASSDSAYVIPTQFQASSVDKGNSTFDVRHSFDGAFTYAVPNPAEGRIGNALLHNWSLQGIFTARTALPFDILASGYSINPLFYAIPRADIVPGQPQFLYSSAFPGGKEADPNAFTTLQPGEVQGNLGRNSLRGFGLAQFDFSLMREFKLTDAARLEFRAEAFNIFNHPNFANPGDYPGFNNYIGAPSFGQSPAMLSVAGGGGGNQGGINPLFSTGGPRDLQLALRLSF